MGPWTIIGWLLLFSMGGALLFVVIGFTVSLIMEGVMTMRRNREIESRVERQMKLYVQDED